MRKRAILAFILVAALALTSSCSLIVKDPEVDKQTVIIDVAGKTFTKSEVSDTVQQQLAYQKSMYSMMYGYDIDITNAEIIDTARNDVINALIEDTVVKAKVVETGMDQFTDEELAELQNTAHTTYHSYEDSIKSSYFSESELEGEELEKAIADKMTELGYPTEDELLENEKSTKGVEKLKADIVKEVTVNDDEVQTEYDTRVNNAMQTYSGNAAQYGTDVQNNSTIYYTPAGYRYVKHILRNFLADDKTKIDGLNSELSDKQTQLTNVQGTLADMGEDETADTEEQAKQRKDLNDTIATLNTEIADLTAQLASAKEAAYAALQPTIDEIQLKLTEGGDFDALMEEYGEDQGMQSSPAKENGYPVSADSTNWVTPFKDAAMALASIGDISPATRSDFGIHIIKYVSDAKEGATELAEVKDAISSELLTNKQDELYNETVAGWVKDANAKIYKDKLAD